ncbi:heme-binding domain-containing protein [Aureisphaera galaxeae]|uniref:heme-binding domain-containing protein n=1 Tax=Aureisphaera galaxeae TaxID=1538023 RepID=UPI00234FC12D|nr:heme-binding domain-containing protein [Aureisphaera galaxeae]MDC8006351.1 heme-binding domain-containing protein [Aureisphaera galaxeae]
MKRIIKWILRIALLALIVIQFIRPEKNNGGYDSLSAFEAETKPSTQVVEILKTNCYDCHSDQTQYPWYAEIAPVSYWLDDHIRHGKGDFNMSDWESYSVKKKDHKLEEVIEEVKEGHMPLDSYTWIHGDLSEEDKKALLLWADLARMSYRDELKVSAN